MWLRDSILYKWMLTFHKKHINFWYKVGFPPLHSFHSKEIFKVLSSIKEFHILLLFSLRIVLF